MRPINTRVRDPPPSGRAAISRADEDIDMTDRLSRSRRLGKLRTFYANAATGTRGRAIAPLLAAFAALAASAPFAPATGSPDETACAGDPLVADDFDAENGGTPQNNYDAFVKWAVTEGSVDLTNAYVPGRPGLWVDLDGSTNDAGRLASKDRFTLLPGTYRLSFELAGNQRGDEYGPDVVDVTLGVAYSESFTLAASAPFATVVRDVTVTVPELAVLAFDHSGGDNVGLFLDEVDLCRTTGPLALACAGAPLVADGFDGENGGVAVNNYAAFASWNVAAGSVDLSEGYVPLTPGLYVDLDGSTGDAGRLESAVAFALAPDAYRLSFDLAGNQRGDQYGPDVVTVTLGGGYAEPFTLPANAPFVTVVRAIAIASPTTAVLAFDHAGGDNVGLFLDNVALCRAAE